MLPPVTGFHGAGDFADRSEATLSRDDAAIWLQALSRAFSRGGEVELPVGDGGRVGLRLPEHVRAEFEVEVEGDEVEVEVKFSWSTSHREDVGGGGATSGS